MNYLLHFRIFIIQFSGIRPAQAVRLPQKVFFQPKNTPSYGSILISISIRKNIFIRTRIHKSWYRFRSVRA